MVENGQHVVVIWSLRILFLDGKLKIGGCSRTNLL